MPLLFVREFPTGTDEVEVSVQIVITETGTGVDDLGGSDTSVVVTDTGVGNDTISAVGGDTSTQSISEFGTGSDDVAISVAFGISDGLNISENVGGSSSTTIISISETGVGVDTTSIAVALSISELGVGDDTGATPVEESSKEVTDTGTGEDSLQLILQKTITDSGLGIDSVTSTDPDPPDPAPPTPTTVEALVKHSTLPGYVELFEIDCTAIPGVGVIYYVTPNVNTNNTKVVFGGETYEPYAIQLTGLEQNTEGAPPRPVLSIGNVNILFGTLTFLFEDIVGAKVIYYRTFASYLGTGQKISAPPMKFYIGKKLNHTIKSLSWELRSPLDKERSYLPKRQMLKREFPGLGINKAIR